MAPVIPEESMEEPKTSKVEGSVVLNKVCFFTISDFVEDKVRVRCLNVVAFTLIYVYFVFALLKTGQQAVPQVKSVRFANPPPAVLLSGSLGDDLRGFYTGIGMIANRSQKIFVIDDTGSPMKDAHVEVGVQNFVANGPLPCSKDEMDAKRLTVEARRLQHVCRYEEVEQNTGSTDDTGLITLNNFTLKGPAGIYTLVPSVEGVSSSQEGIMLVSSPVASLEVVDDTLPELPLVSAPRVARIGEPLSWQPRVLIRDMRGLPVPGRKIIAFANPDPTWPISGPSARTPPYNRRGQKVVELNCPESELSDDNGIARFTCLGIASSNVDHVNIVFSDSALSFYPWNDGVYSPRSAYPLIIQSYRYSTYIIPRVHHVQVVQGVPWTAAEGVPFHPQPALSVTDVNGAPLAGVTCYALSSIEMGGRNPNWFRRQMEGVKNKELLDAVAITDANGTAQFATLRWSVEGNTMDLELLKNWATQTSIFSVSFNCEGVEQDTHAWAWWSGSFINHVEPKVAAIRIKRFIRKSAQMARYFFKGKEDGSDIFLAVVRVVDAEGNGIPGKTVEVMYNPDDPRGWEGVRIELLVGSVEQTNDRGFAVVAFQAITGPANQLDQNGHFDFTVRFLLDGVVSEPSEALTARLVGGLKPEECHIVEPLSAYFYHISSGSTIPMAGYPIYMSSGDIFYSTLRLRGAAHCVTFPNISTPNTSACKGRRLQEAPDFEMLRRRLSDGDSHRNLQSADGFVGATAVSYYSTAADKWGKVRFEPSPMLEISLTHQYPTDLREYNSNPEIAIAAVLNGPSGDHWVRTAVETITPEGTKQVCVSRPVPIRLQNAVGDIEVFGDGGPGALYEMEVEAGGYVDIDLRMVLDSAFVNASDLSSIPSCIFSGEKYLEPCSISFFFRNAPYNYHAALGLMDTAASPRVSEFHSLLPVQKTAQTNGNGYDHTTGMLHLRFKMLQVGIWGNFAIQFSGFGVNTRLFTWRVKPPPGLRLEIVQEPAFASTRPLSGNLLDVLPAVKVMSDNGPVNGTILSFEPIPEDGANFEKLTRVPMFSPFIFLYSQPSGKPATNLYGTSLGPAEAGLAYFTAMGMPDGSGCTRFQFHAEGPISSASVPSTPICLEHAFDFSIVNQPPPSWPLGIELQEFGGAITVEVRPRYELPEFTRFAGGLFVRLIVSSEGGRDVEKDTAFELSQRMLGDAVCAFVGNVEQLGRCSSLEVVQETPFYVLRFSFLSVTWIRRMSQPAKLKLQVSDLSGSGVAPPGEALPSGFADLTPAQQFISCAAAASASSEVLTVAMTPEITAETTAAQYAVVLPPPNAVTVGSMFLVRLRVSTASGGPVRDVRVRVGIKALTSTSPQSTSPELLQSLAAQGNSIAVTADGNVELDPSTVVRTSNVEGIIGFPLTVTRAGSGTYQLQFQPDVPDSHIVIQTAPFKVENTIYAISSPALGKMEIESFGKVVRVPATPRFCISTATNESLHQLQADGIKLSISLQLKGAPQERETQATRLAKQAKQQALEGARSRANEMARRFSQTANPALRAAAETLIANVNRKAKGIFAGLSEEFAVACLATPASQLLSGDPSLAQNIGNSSEGDSLGFVAEQAPSLAEAVGMDPSALDPTESLNQFTEVLMSAGSTLRPARQLALEGQWRLQLSDMVPFDHCYEINKSLDFAFKEGMDYSFSLAVNGVEGPGEPFKVSLAPADPVDLAINWIVSAVAGILGVILLTTNTMTHHWTWFFVSIGCTVGMCIALPFMSLHKDAVFGSWLYIAAGNFVLIVVALAWGLTLEMGKRSDIGMKAMTFEEKRFSIFEEYSLRKIKELLERQSAPSRRSALKDTFLKPFNSHDAFFFPSAFLIANFLSFLSFIYVLLQSIQVLRGLQEFLQKILNTAVDRSISFASSINTAYYQAVGSDLPDSSTEFMYVQINVMRSWFQQLINSIIIGFTTGIILAAILTLAGQLGGFVHFRQSVLDARRGKFAFKKSDAKLVFATSYIGVNISSSIVSFILIVGLVTLLLIPFTFALTWRVIWAWTGTILLTFVLPKVLTFVSTTICKTCIFGPTFIKTRAGASIFHFYINFLALPGGVVTAVVRFVTGLLGVIAMLPITYGANSPSMIENKLLLDSSYRTYIAYVMLYATHNNPIMITAAQRLLHIKAARERIQEEKKHWTSSRSLLILILIRFPHLRQYRKHVLQQERVLLEDKKKSGVKVCVEDGKGAGSEEPWIAHAMEEALQEGAQVQRKIELMIKYRSALKGLDIKSAAYREMSLKLREISRGAPTDAPVPREDDESV